MNVSVGVLGVGTVQKVTAPASLSIGVKGEDSYLIRYTTENIGVRVDGGVGVKVTLRFGAGTSGSGTIDIADADTLDGYHAEAFARKAEAAHILEAWRFLKKIGIGFGQDEQIEAYLHNKYDSILNGPVLMGDYVRSRQGFQEGFGGYGWEIDRDGNMTIESLVVRKALKVYELIINQIRATNGSLWVSDSAEILTVTGNTANSYLCRIDSDKGNIAAPFVDGDIVRCQRWTGRGIKYYTGVVLSVSSDTFVLEVIDGTDAPEAKDPVVRIGNRTDGNRQGALYLTASDEGAPYMDVMDGVTDAFFAGKIKARLGKLSGLNYNGKPLTGYGLFAELAYLTGAIRNANGKWALNEDGSGSLASGAITWTAEGKLTITGVPKDVSDAINGALTKFINEEYSQAIQNINTQLDKKAETFYQTGMPHAEFIGIDTNAEYDKWVNDMWYNSDPTVRKSYLYTKRVNANNAAKVDYVWAYMDIPKELFDQFDGKKTIYTAKPSKYAIDDIWITESDTIHSKYKKGEILVSGATRTAYQEGDWMAKVRYTDDAALDTFKKTYQSNIAEIQKQNDKRLDYFFTEADPSTGWGAEEIFNKWYNTTTNRAFEWRVLRYEQPGRLKFRYIRDWLNYNNKNSQNHWVEIKAFDFNGNNVALGKPIALNSIVANIPNSVVTNGLLNSYQTDGFENSYLLVDLGSNHDLEKLIVWHYYDGRIYHNTKTEVSVDGITWYTTFDSAVTGEYPETVDGRTDTLTINDNIVGDLVPVFGWVEITDKAIIELLAKAKDAKDTADKKRRVFTNILPDYPLPPFDEGDLWVQGENGDIMVCKATYSGAKPYDVATYWRKSNKYTDDSLAESKSQTYYTDWFSHPQTGESYDPAAAWTTNEEKNKHVGDSWIAHDGTYSVTDGITRTAQHTKIYRLIDGTYSWVRTETTINGGQIETGSVKADRIDVTDLFTKELTATNFNAKGGSVGNFTINQKLVGESSGNIIELDPDAASIKIISSDNRIIRFMPGPLSSVDDITMDNFSWQNTVTNDINTVALSQNQLKANKTNWVALAYNTKYCGKNGTQSYWNSAIPADSYQFQLGVAGQKSDYTITIPTILLQKHNGKTSNGRNYKRHGNLKLELVTTIFNADGTVVTSQAYTNEVFIDDRSQDTLLFGGVHRFQVRTTGVQKFYIQIKSKLCGDLTYQRWYTGTFESYWTTLESEALQFAVGTNQNFKIAGAMGITEISTNGIQTVWSKEAFFRIDGDQFGGKFIETKGLWNHNGYNITTLANDVGQLQADLQNYYTKTETGNTFALKAHKHLWADIDEKPVTFAPSAHSHQQSEVASTSGWISTELGKKLDAISFSDLFEKKVDGSGNTYIQAKYTLASTGGLAAYTAANINVPSVFDALPIASAVSLGGIKVGTNLTIDANGVLHAQAGGVSSWDDLSNKPAWLNYATQAAFEGGHGHAWTQIAGKPATFTPAAHTHLWADLTDKPVTFAPSAHNHAQSDIATTGWITNALAGKAASSHTHTIANITNLQTTLDGKANAAHTHSQAGIDSGAGWISTALAGKLNSAGTAVDSLKLGGLSAGDYARKNASENITGKWSFNFSDTIGTNVNDYVEQLSHRLSNIGSFVQNKTMAVVLRQGQDWTNIGEINGFSVDGSFTTPTSMRAWYKRDIMGGAHHFGNGEDTYMVVSGNVGIGIFSPTEKLHVSGNIRATGALKSSSTELLNASGVMQYRFTTSGTDCLIANAAGTTIGKFDQSGNLMMKGGIACYATI